ncbi:MAG: YihY/virulence factor BrkB family protein [Candidatus Riflebacteria bacterium]|nr:YihY/virulence factor BrkB family protein [Candidatus Riflebacteria bacterium]
MLKSKSVPTYMYNPLNFIRHVFNRVIETRVTEAAAAIAYYAILSFFPLLLFLIAFNSSFLQSVEVQNQILKFAEEYMPGSESLVAGNIQHLIRASGAVGMLGTAMLLWSATLVFAGFAQNINLAWTTATTRHFLIDRLIGLMMISILVIFLILSLIANTLIDVLPQLFPTYLEAVFAQMTRFNQILIDYLPQVTIFWLLLLLYKYTPNLLVKWHESLAGTIFSMLALQLTKLGFVWYLSFGTDSYSLIYGSLGAVVAFLLWVYLSSCIILIGGHVSSAVALYFRPAREVSSPGDPPAFI